jgi:glutamate dehydrogenase (NADP+)
VRTEATGYGAVFFVQEMLAVHGDTLEGKRVGVSGSGNVAIYAIDKARQLGGLPVTASDSSGYVIDDAGIDVDLLRQLKEVERVRISEYAVRRPRARFIPGAQPWEVPMDVAIPSATQNEIDEHAARALVEGGVRAVAEGANMPSTPEAVEVFQSAGVLFGPGKAVNAGGVATSALEMTQNAGRERWSFADSEHRLRAIMRDVHAASFTAARRYGHEGDYVVGANCAGFERVAKAMLAQGVI